MAEVKKAKAAPVKEEVKAAEVKTEAKVAPKAETKPEVKEAAKSEAKKLGRKPAVKKVAAKKETEKKAAVRKPAAKKAEVNETVNFQFNGKSYTPEDLVKSCKDVWKYDLNGKEEDIKSIELYVKPEENTTYYVINGDVTGSFFI
ncbi:MAG: hypothetical protein HFI44_07120 [Lachnospiraceae bacterium]|jgi:nucleoid-associated protein YgaU|nr:hypothetical protein [Lachnospiraceae bacterium]GFI02803.1 hypothetical protein IMSAGC005_01634 [Lachnospiraceae bacterium]